LLSYKNSHKSLLIEDVARSIMGLLPEPSKENTKKVKVGAAEVRGRAPPASMGVHPLEAAHPRAVLIQGLPVLLTPDSLLEIDTSRTEIIRRMENLKCIKMDRE
jgi:hypothetical protein